MSTTGSRPSCSRAGLLRTSCLVCSRASSQKTTATTSTIGSWPSRSRACLLQYLLTVMLKGCRDDAYHGASSSTVPLGLHDQGPRDRGLPRRRLPLGRLLQYLLAVMLKGMSSTVYPGLHAQGPRDRGLARRRLPLGRRLQYLLAFMFKGMIFWASRQRTTATTTTTGSLPSCSRACLPRTSWPSCPRAS